MASPLLAPEMTPVETRQEHSVSVPPSYPPFPTYVKQITSRLSREQDGSWRERHAKALTNELMYRGQQLGRVSTFDLQWRPLVQNAKNEPFPLKVYNFIRPNSDAVTAQGCLSRSDLQVIPLPKHKADEKAKGQAEAANYVLDYYEDTTETETFLIREDKLGQFCGNVIRRIRWNPNGGPIVLRPKYEDAEVKTGPDTYTCPQCQESGTPEQLVEGMCPYCGSPAEINEAPTVVAPQFVGHEEVRAGDVETDIIPGYQVRCDSLGGDFEQSSWVQIQFQMRPEEVKQVIPWWNSEHPRGKSADGGVLVEQKLQAATGTGSTGRISYQREGGGNPRVLIVQLWWFKPCWYSNVTSPQDEKWGNPENPIEIPANTKFGDVFKSGMYSCLVDGEPIDFRDEDFIDRLFHCQRYPVPSQTWGDGIEDVNDPQRGINLKRALKEANIRYNVGSGMIYRGRYLKGGAPHGIPFERIPVEPNWPIDKPLTGPSGVVTALERPQLSREVFESEQEDQQAIQYQLKAFPTSLGAADTQGGGTATEASLMNQGARNQRAVELAPYAAFRARWARGVLKMFRENAGESRPMPLMGRTGEMEMKWFMGSDIDGQYVVSSRPRSWLPRGEMEYQADLKAAFELIGVMGGLQVVMAAPRLREQIEEAFNISLAADDSDVSQRYCRWQLERMKEAMEQMGQEGMVDPQMAVMTILAAAPVLPTVQNHPVCIAYIQKILQEDEGIRFPDALKIALVQRIEEHKMAMVQSQVQSTSMEMEANAPAQEAAAAQEAEARGQEAQANDEQNRAERADKFAGEERQREHEHNLAKEKNATAVDLAKVRAATVKKGER